MTLSKTSSQLPNPVAQPSSSAELLDRLRTRNSAAAAAFEIRLKGDLEHNFAPLGDHPPLDLIARYVGKEGTLPGKVVDHLSHCDLCKTRANMWRQFIAMPPLADNLDHIPIDDIAARHPNDVRLDEIRGGRGKARSALEESHLGLCETCCFAVFGDATDVEDVEEEVLDIARNILMVSTERRR